VGGKARGEMMFALGAGIEGGARADVYQQVGQKRRGGGVSVRAGGHAVRGGVASTSLSSPSGVVCSAVGGERKSSRRSLALGVPLGLLGLTPGVGMSDLGAAAAAELSSEEKRALRVENAEKVKEGIRVFGGWAFTLGTAVYAVKVLKRRAQRAKDVRLRSDGVTDLTQGLPREGDFGIVETEEEKRAEAETPERDPSAFEAFQGSAIALGCAFVLYQFTAGVEESVTATPITQYDSDRAARFSVIVRTFIVGGFYLITFIFGANSVGLFLLGCQKALGLDKKDDAGADAGVPATGGAAEAPSTSTVSGRHM